MATKTRSKNTAAETKPAEETIPAESAANGELLDIDEAMARLKTTRPTFYRWLRTGKLKGMKVGRQWRFYKKDIESFLKGEEPQVELPADIRPLIQQLQDRHGKSKSAKLASPPEANVTTAVNLMTLLAIEMRANVLHLEPLASAGGEPASGQLRFRIDGTLHSIAKFDGRLLRPITDRWKTMGGCDLHDHVSPQDCRIMLNIGGKPYDLRVCFLPTHFGDSLTARILNADQVSFDIDNIDFSPRDRERIVRALAGHWGMIVSTGPAGSGKTTFLYSALNRLTRPDQKVVTIENPIEVALPGVTQIQINPRVESPYVYNMRAVMRSDPDVIMVGELRDGDTVSMAVEAALTGHIVLTALHTDEAASALSRMVEITGEPILISDAVKLIVAHRLIRKLCPECSEVEGRSESNLKRAEMVARVGGLGELPGKNFRKPMGCSRCRQTGFNGRTIVAETLAMSPEIVAALRRGAKAEELRTLAIGQGMVTMAADAVRRASMGQIHLEEALRYLPALG